MGIVPIGFKGKSSKCPISVSYCNCQLQGTEACIHHGADADETCVDCLKSKANIGRPKGLRDDLVFLLEEDLSHINLCSLHCEMRNTEQLLGSLGLSARRVGCLHLLDAALSSYGAESQQDFSCIKVEEKPGQQTGIERANIKVASFSGEFCSGIDLHIF